MAQEDGDVNQRYWAQIEDDDAIPTTSASENSTRRFDEAADDRFEQTVATELYVPSFKKPEALEISLDPIVVQTIQLHQFKRFVSDPANDGTQADLPSLRKAPKMSARLPELTKRDAHELTRKGCAALGAQVGFQDADAEALEILTDVTKEKLEELCEKLKVFHERRLLNRESAFPSAVQQLLSSVGLQSPLDLRDFYERRVRSYRDRLLADCQDLTNEKR
uniref:Bromodomain associated domain-containing protein n=1 Tax=Plectus sambesii TaxID=2011161 RepID=A0A914X0I4_9BILA